MKYILSYGGGVNSSALLFYILEKNLPLDEIIFADTGEEMPHTYDAVKRMEFICKEKKIKFTIVKSKYGNLYEYYFNNKIIPSMMKRDCTSKFKIAPIRQYLRNIYGKKEVFTMYIGITWDEHKRIRESDVKYIVNYYPFCDDRITRIGNIDILNKYNFIASKSGCKGCIYNRKNEWIKMIMHNPQEYERHIALEENNRRFPELLLNGSYKLRDLKEGYKNQKSIFEFEEVKLKCSSVNGGCFL